MTLPAMDEDGHLGERAAAPCDEASVDVTIGDFSTTRVEGSFSLVYLVFNTIMNRALPFSLRVARAGILR